MLILPEDIRALTIRQPWCEYILRKAKDVENRTWSTNFRGLVLIHAGKGVDPEAKDVVRDMGLPLGGIVGVMKITDCVQHMDSEWFYGPYGFVIAEARPLHFTPCKGALGFFRPDIDIGALREVGP